MIWTEPIAIVARLVGVLRLLWPLLAGAAASFVVLQYKPIQAKWKYDAGFASIELLGVCKVTETGVQCWKPDRGPARELAEQVAAEFAKSDYRLAPVRPGQKTRLAIFRIKNPNYGRPSKGSINEMNSQYSFDLQSQDPSPAESDSRTTIRAVVVSGGLRDRSAQAATIINFSVPASARIELVPGSSIEYGGTKYTFAEVIKSTIPPEGYPVDQPKQGWVIRLTKVPVGDPSPIQSWTALDDHGLRIQLVDSTGSPLIGNPDVAYSYVNRLRSTDEPKFFIANLGASAYPSPGSYALYTNIDPSKIKALVIQGSATQALTITDIPLDPR